MDNKTIDHIKTIADEVVLDRTPELTDREKAILKALPKSVLRNVDKILSQYKPTHPKYDIRKMLVLKSIAQLAAKAKTLYHAYKLGETDGINSASDGR